MNSYDIKSNKASSNFDQRHLLHISYIYELPLLRFFDHFLHSVDLEPTNEAGSETRSAKQPWSSNSKVRSFLGGWELSALRSLSRVFRSLWSMPVVLTASPRSTTPALRMVQVLGRTLTLSGLSPRSPKPVGGSNSRSVGPLLLNPGAFVAPRGLTFGTPAEMC